MTVPKHDDQRYRSNVGLVLFSRAGHVFLGRRINDKGAFQWQFPQGGVDAGESPSEAVLREMTEETGVSNKLVDILEETQDWLYYDFPRAFVRRSSAPYLGQRQKWFALRFKGSDSDICLDRHKPEFDAWRWACLADVPSGIVPFKRPVYAEIARRFARWSEPDTLAAG